MTKMASKHVIVPNGYVLTCRDLDEFGTEDDDPVTVVSDENAPCVNTVDTYECSYNDGTYNDGYSGNGKVYVDVNECDSDDATANE